MRLTLINLHLYLPACHSLKEKRRILQGIKTRIRNRMNVSVAEVEYQDKWQRSNLAVAWISSDGSGIDQTIAAIDKLVDGYSDVQVTKIERSDY